LSGGPASVKADFSPKIPKGLLDLGLPTLGICYGMQIFSKEAGGDVDAAEHREFGRAALQVVASSKLFEGLGESFDVWMSHGDQVHSLPSGFKTIAKSATCPHAAVEYADKLFWGVQFHPEVVHTSVGKQILHNFLINIAGLTPSWEMSSFLQQKIDHTRELVQDGHVLMGLSGGVDSSVAATLIHKAIGDKLTCIYVDNGLSRLSEVEEVEKLFREEFHLNLHIVDAKQEFFGQLAGVTDPEQKRKIIGRVFVEVFEAESKKISDVRFLGQGTLYPDVVESVSAHGGPSDVIKSHHNVGGLPERMKLKLVEPLRELFKDEVRELGLMMGLPTSLIMRQPFPGPGLAVRILGEVTPTRCTLLQKADAIVRQEVEAAMMRDEISKHLWQWFAVLLPIRSVGVMGDARTYGETIAVRCVESTDGMTADWANLPGALLGRISNRIMNEVKGISRVVYDISSKPPSTIEWE
jgi:GMP synthase (glutamine-hydrolysing)